jgi:hypothetical protein
MTVESDKVARHLRNIRRRYDVLLREHGGKRPSNYAKMRQFTMSLMQIVSEETTSAGLAQSPVHVLPPKKKIEENIASEIKNKGQIRTKADIERENPPAPKPEPEKGPVYVPDAEDLKAMGRDPDEELREELDEKADEANAEETEKVIEDVENRLEEDPDSKGLSEEALAELG